MLTAERVDIIGLLEGLPPFATCTTEVLESFVAHDAMRAHCAPGEVLCGLQQDHNLYVLIAGEAVLRVGPDVTINLEPGDYFGQQAHRHHRIAGTVVAVSDVEVLVVGPAGPGSPGAGVLGVTAPVAPRAPGAGQSRRTPPARLPPRQLIRVPSGDLAEPPGSFRRSPSNRRAVPTVV